MTHTQAIVQLTNEGLSDNNKVPTTAGMILKFFGMIILCTKFEFKSWSSLWSTTAASNMFQLHPLGQQVWVECALMIFGGIFAGASSLLSVRQKWAQKNFVGGWWTILLKASMADHRASTFQPSDVICVDESISRWYGKGDHWINFSLPMYVAMERKPDNWCEIQNSAGGRSGIMMRLKLVKTADENRAAAEEQGETERVPHSAAIINKLVLPWIHTDRIVCADSSFASVPTVKLLNLHGMQFVGVEKTATRNYPMRFLSPVMLNHRGDWKGLVSNGLQTGDPTMLTFVLMDCWQTRYFIASASSLEAGTPYKRWRWQQVDTIPNADPTNVELLVPQPKAAELFFSAYALFDRHNWARQLTLGLESKLETHEWALRVNMTIFAMTVVDTWLAYSQCSETQQRDSQKNFYTVIAEELIDNTYDSVNVRGRRNPGQPGMSPTLFERASGDPRAACYAHLNPPKKRKRTGGVETPFSHQRRWMICESTLTTFACSLCMDENPDKEAWVCYTQKNCVTPLTWLSTMGFIDIIAVFSFLEYNWLL